MGETVFHTLPPVYDSHSRVLILGSIPSPKSRETGFYYGHPQNRFWAALSGVLKEPLPRDIPEKRALLLRRGIALWDVLARCEIAGASDASIRHPVANDFTLLFQQAPIAAVFTTGSTAHRLYQKLCAPATGRDSLLLPSPSPANCRVSLTQLVEAYRAILPYL